MANKQYHSFYNDKGFSQNMTYRINHELRNIIQNAYSTRALIDSQGTIDKYELNKYAEFLNSVKDCPTRYAIIKRNCYDKAIANYPCDFIRNLRYIDRNPEIKNIKRYINEKFITDYPKTKFIRKYIINKERISLACITGKKGYGIGAKLNIYTDKLISKFFNKKFKI